MKKSILQIILSAAALVVVSCERWLDVVPSSQIRAEEHYSTVEGFQQTLIGCYLAMTKADLYGQNLSWHAIEMLGRQYDPRSNAAADDYSFDRYNYTATKSVNRIERIWESSYAVIVNANEALDYIDRKRESLDSINYRIIKGELLAVRAYLHFDLMRLFGCSNLAGRADLEKRNTIPYVTTVNKEMSPQLSYRQTIRNLVADLTEALRLLEIDPVCGLYPKNIYYEANADGFYDARSQHLNYFAVKALLARVYMWEGSAESRHLALQTALDVIDNTAVATFGVPAKWRTFTAADKTNTNEMCFPSEHLFALNVKDLQLKTGGFLAREFTADDSKFRALRIKNAKADELFEIKTVGITDCRYKQLYHNLSSSSSGTKTPSKLYQQTSNGTDYTYKDLVPLIRISELYYIAAECYASGADKSAEKARDMLDRVRTARAVYTQLDPALDETGLKSEIEKEYRKEFICEGVLFYFYKRLGYNKLPRQEDVMSADAAITDAVYMLPYPSFELQSGRVQ